MIQYSRFCKGGSPVLEEYLKIFNDYLEVQDINGALNYIDKIFIDSKYLKVKNLFLYLLGCITISYLISI